MAYLETGSRVGKVKKAWATLVEEGKYKVGGTDDGTNKEYISLSFADMSTKRRYTVHIYTKDFTAKIKGVERRCYNARISSQYLTYRKGVKGGW